MNPACAGRFIVVHHGKWLCVVSNGVYVIFGKGENIEFINLSNRENPKQMAYMNLEAGVTPPRKGNLEIYGWSEDSNLVWGYFFENAFPYSIFSADVTTESTESVEKYNVVELPLQVGEIAINTNKSYLAYSDYPPIFDLHEIKEFKRSEEKITLNVYNLMTGKSRKIGTSKGVPFKPMWVGEYTLEYDDPEGTGRNQTKVSFD